MKEFIDLHPALLWSIAGLILLLVLAATFWQQIKWWWFNTWVNFPLIGRIATLSRDANEDIWYPGWFCGERTLCQEYKDFVHLQDELDFDEKVTYLTKAGDNGRSGTPGWIWLLTVVMVFIEALGFSYVLAGYTIPGASENLQQTGAYGIAFLIAAILVAFTHLAGHELYKSGRIKNARREWVEDKRRFKLSTGTIPLARPQNSDDHMPAYTQLCNRVGAHPTYLVSIATLIIVLLIAGAATYVRGQVLEKELVARVTHSSQRIDSMDLSRPLPRLPDADAASDRDADRKAASDEADIDRHGGWATFIVLAFVFVFLQMLGVIFGYRWGFAGQNSAQAFREMGHGQYSSYAAMRESYRRVADTAQARLAVLQQKIMARNSHVGTSGQHLSKTFRDYIQETRIADQAEWQNQRHHAEAVRRQQAASQDMGDAAPPADSAVDAVMEQLAALGDDKAAKLAILSDLPDQLQQQVITALKRRKQAQARRARNTELENLL
ncbi:hypothetical protein GJ699_16915 [Duganella sp. FT80W]|uniref:Uncharacterized protein n=1 Tax=Duganella guangzhouensis TaxID=2666084 RepID=A0A6I2L4W4_9BURK|nr:hypothetical protein [Duganella guangzhouensis]MRW91676.1 hypothetical protein [Duganella guangzhouensis]